MAKFSYCFWIQFVFIFLHQQFTDHLPCVKYLCCDCISSEAISLWASFCLLTVIGNSEHGSKPLKNRFGLPNILFLIPPPQLVCVSLWLLFETQPQSSVPGLAIPWGRWFGEESRVCPPPPGPFRPRVSGVPGCPQITLRNQPGGNGIFNLLPNSLNTRPLLIINLTRIFPP